MAWLLLLVQAVLAGRVVWRLVRTAGGQPIPDAGDTVTDLQPVTVVVPVLNEAGRLGPCLDGLREQPAPVAEILVVDGGSADGTRELALAASRQDPRVRLIDANPVPPDWNGKAWGLQVGAEAAAPTSRWLLTVDADVRPRRGLVDALASHAVRERLEAASVATLQELTGPALGLLHPACLATLVYRLGSPGRIARRPAEVQANGQCMLFERRALAAIGDFQTVRASRCEDVTIARALAAAGGRVGLFETDGLVTVRMYEDWRGVWDGWARSLPLRDRYTRWSSLVGLAEVTLVQAAPLPVMLAGMALGWPRAAPVSRRAAFWLNLGLLGVRSGVLVGTRRAYRDPPWTYWLSPLADICVALRLWASMLKRRHVWRGRSLVDGAVT